LFVAEHLLLRDFGLYRVIFVNVWAVTAVAVDMLLLNFGSYGIIFMRCVFIALEFPVILDGLFSGDQIII
jgi:hypothetical protein